MLVKELIELLLKSRQDDIVLADIGKKKMRLLKMC